MAQLTVKGYTFTFSPVRDSFNRRAVKFQNNIHSTLRKIGLTQDDVECDLEPVAMRKAPAKVVWYFDGRKLHYDYNGQAKFVDNLYVASKIIELEVDALLSEQKSVDEFCLAFQEDDDLEEQRKAARELLGVEADSRDLADINKKYKLLAKQHHPDMDGGDHETFQALNRAHKTLKRELE